MTDRPLEMIILMGLQASGKSTFYRERFLDTHVHISKDNFPNARRPERRQQALLEEALAGGRRVVVDNTNPSASDRERLIAQAAVHGARVVGYYFNSVVSECVERNEARPARQRVKLVGLYAVAKRLERPTYREGFDALYYVTMQDGSFKVEDWID